MLASRSTKFLSPCSEKISSNSGVAGIGLPLLVTYAILPGPSHSFTPWAVQAKLAYNSLFRNKEFLERHLQ